MINLLRRLFNRRHTEIVIPVQRAPITRVVPGKIESYERAMHDAVALSEAARERFYVNKALRTQHYLNDPVARSLKDAVYLALQHPSVRNAIADQQFYERLANMYANALRAQRTSEGTRGE